MGDTRTTARGSGAQVCPSVLLGYPFTVPNGYCPNHSTGVTLPDDFVVTPLQYVE